MPWREEQPHADAELPGVFLAGERYREGMTQAAIANAFRAMEADTAKAQPGKKVISLDDRWRCRLPPEIAFLHLRAVNFSLTG